MSKKENNTPKITRRTALAALGISAVGGPAATAGFSKLTADRPVNLSVEDAESAVINSTTTDDTNELTITNQSGNTLAVDIIPDSDTVTLEDTTGSANVDDGDTIEISELADDDDVILEFENDADETVTFEINAFTDTDGFEVQLSRSLQFGSTTYSMISNDPYEEVSWSNDVQGYYQFHAHIRENEPPETEEGYESAGHRGLVVGDAWCRDDHDQVHGYWPWVEDPSTFDKYHDDGMVALPGGEYDGGGLQHTIGINTQYEPDCGDETLETLINGVISDPELEGISSVMFVTHPSISPVEMADLRKEEDLLLGCDGWQNVSDHYWDEYHGVLDEGIRDWWHFASDDYAPSRESVLDTNRNYIIVNEHTQENVVQALIDGRFYSTHSPDENPPEIDEIVVDHDNNKITINSNDGDTCKWITTNGQTLHEEFTLEYEDYEQELDGTWSYALVEHSDGEAATQPWAFDSVITASTDHENNTLTITNLAGDDTEDMQVDVTSDNDVTLENEDDLDNVEISDGTIEISDLSNDESVTLEFSSDEDTVDFDINAFTETSSFDKDLTRTLYIEEQEYQSQTFVRDEWNTLYEIEGEDLPRPDEDDTIVEDEDLFPLSDWEVGDFEDSFSITHGTMGEYLVEDREDDGFYWITAQSDDSSSDDFAWGASAGTFDFDTIESITLRWSGDNTGRQSSGFEVGVEGQAFEVVGGEEQDDTEETFDTSDVDGEYELYIWATGNGNHDEETRVSLTELTLNE